MMKIAIVADLHGNRQATEAMEEMLGRIQPDECWFLGDAVGKGPDSVFTCDWVRTHCTVCVGGNWDYGVGGKEFPEDVYWWDLLGEERLAWLNGLPREARLTMSGVRFRLFHGRPVSPLMKAQTDSEVMTPFFTDGEERFGGVIFADSHRPFVRTLDIGYIVNTGSVGNSLGVPRAHALLLEGEKDSLADAPLTMTVLSVPYDKEAAIAAAGPELPHRAEYIKEITEGIYAR